MTLSLFFSSFVLTQPGCVFEIDDDDEDASLSIRNASDFAIDEIRVTQAGDPDFGPNLVGGDLLLPGEEITVLVDCDFYDVLVVDETGLGCELLGLELCFEDAFWIIDNTTLETCQFAQASD